MRVKQRFRRALTTYDQAATVQARMAERLVRALSRTSHRYSRVFEIGAGTGLFTRLARQELQVEFYLACDLVSACAYFLQPLGVTFVVADGENPSWLRGEFDLIVSNAVFQWFENPQGAMARLAERLVPGGFLAFTTFGRETMREIPGETPPGLLSLSEWQALKPLNFREIRAERHLDTLYFADFFSVLRHIRETGALGGLTSCWSLKTIRKWQREYERFQTSRGYPLTFEPILVIWQKVV